MGFWTHDGEAAPLRSILLDQAATLGDLVLSTVCLQAVADSSPDIRVSCLCRESTAGLLQGHAAIDHVYTESTGTGTLDSRTHSLFRLRRLRMIIDQARVDAVAVLWNRPAPLVPIAIKLARVPIRCGSLDREGYGWMFNAGCARGVDPTRHEAGQHLECLRSLDLQAAAISRLSLALEPQDVDDARRTLSELGIARDDMLVALSPGAGGSNRSLSPDTHARFVQLIRQRFDARTILLESPDERTLTARSWSHPIHRVPASPGPRDAAELITTRDGLRIEHRRRSHSSAAAPSRPVADSSGIGDTLRQETVPCHKRHTRTDSTVPSCSALPRGQ